MTNPAPAVGSAPLRILVADDHESVREGLALLAAAEGMAVAAAAARSAAALAAAGECRPDVAIVDLSLADEDGLALVSELAERGVRTLVYSMHGDARNVGGAFAAGALGYVTKAEARGVLVAAIRAVASGRRFVSPVAAVVLAERLSGAWAGAGSGDPDPGVARGRPPER